MERLGFVLNEFVRFIWVSKKAEQVWSPVISNLSNFFFKIERESVRAGIKPVIIQNVPPDDDFVNQSQRWLMEEGKVMLPLERVNTSPGYRSNSGYFDSTKPFNFVVVIGNRQDAISLAKAHGKNNWQTVGRLLGYPECCIRFFQKYWVEEKWIDTTLPMAQDWRGGYVHPTNNILLRWAGIRLVSHLPCSLTCQKTRELGDSNVTLAHDIGCDSEISQIIEILSWPIEWSSLHGIAIITTPVFRIITSSDALLEKKIIRLQGDKYPREAASGKVFPFRSTKMWTDNGFSSLKAMEEAHNKIIDFIKPLFPKSIIDFGCGNMRLVNICARLFGARVVGVDSDSTKDPTILSDIFDVRVGESFDLALISVNRVNEQPEKAKAWLEELRVNVKYLLVYTYDDGPFKFSIPESWTDGVEIVRSVDSMVLLRLQHDFKTDAIPLCETNSSVN